MSLRFDLSNAADTLASVIDAGNDPYELDLPEGSSALVIGDPCSAAYAVVGTRQELAEFVAGLTALLDLPARTP